ncbi:MAG TPA: hypothetical protein VKV04_13155 [Verrucomicrobiae bacterium]|nr:hypothetical protein [Verrucomicrobiae bacterium]
MSTSLTQSPVVELPQNGLTRFPVLGVGVNAVQIPQVIQILENWIAERKAPKYVAVTGMHGLSEAQHDDIFFRFCNPPIWSFPTACRWSGLAGGAASNSNAASMARN